MLDENVLFGKQDVTRGKVRGFKLLCVMIACSFLAVGPWIFSSDWVSSSDFHAAIEVAGAVMGLAAGVVCLVYFFGLKSRYFLIIGLGFFIAGSEDLVHGILSFERLFASTTLDFSRFIPGTYVAGRTVLALIIIAAPFLERTSARARNPKREALTFSLFALALGGGATALALALPLPRFIFPDSVISRPIDFASALLFVVAFFVTLRRYGAKRDVFSGVLLASILLNVGSQLYMSFSRQLYDVFFDLAHVAKLLSYTMPVLGISMQALQDMKRVNVEILERRRAEQKLAKHKDHLEELVTERTSELEDARVATLNMMEDAEQANEALKKEVAERKQIEEKLRWLATIPEQAVEGIAVADFDGIITFVNPAWANMHGYEPEELTGKHLGIFHTEEQLRNEVIPFNEQVKLKGHHSGESHNRHRNGTVFPTEMNVTLLRNEVGEVTGFLALGTDITERKQAEEVLKKSQWWQRAILDNIPDIAWLKDRDSRYIAANEAFGKLCGHKPEDLAGKTDFGLWPEDLARKYRTDDAEVVRSGQHKRMEEMLEGQDGIRTWVETFKTPLRNDQGKVIGTTGIARDVTVHKRAEEAVASAKQEVEQRAEELSKVNWRLGRAVAEKNDFLRAVSHDLSAPLRNIAGMASFLKSRYADKLDEIGKDRMERILKNIKTQNELIGDLLKLSRIQTRRTSLQQTDLNELLRSVVEQFTFDIEKKSGMVELVGEFPVIGCEANRMRQVFGNLIDNAIKYAHHERPPHIVITGGHDDDNYRFTVTDNGIGMKPEEAQKVFFVFQRAHNALTAQIEGKGVGLATVKAIVESHGGEIWVKSCENGGSSFTFTLPKSAVNGPSPDPDGTGSAETGIESGENIEVLNVSDK